MFTLTKLNKGFTLIELLVVIAVIGTLSSIILTQLTAARSKGDDAKIKQEISNAITRAALFYETTFNENYTSNGGICATLQCASGCVLDMSYACGGPVTASSFRLHKALTVQNQFSGSSGVDYWCGDATNKKKLCDNVPSGNTCAASC
jgi:prepilin-type N-terminal cleavage/methylation domain-containing protein